MKSITLFTVAFVVAWLAVAQAQVRVESQATDDGTFIDGRGNPHGNPNANKPHSGNVNLYSEKPAIAESKRYLEQYRKNSGSDEQNRYQFNPYRIRW